MTQRMAVAGALVAASLMLMPQTASAQTILEQAAEHLRELRIAEIVEKDMVIRNGKIEAYRTKVKPGAAEIC